MTRNEELSYYVGVTSGAAAFLPACRAACRLAAQGLQSLLRSYVLPGSGVKWLSGFDSLQVLQRLRVCSSATRRSALIPNPDDYFLYLRAC